MPELVAALYVCGKVVTGTHHGDAYSKLSDSEKNLEICSGFFNPKTSRFVSDQSEFYTKQVLMVRHAHVNTHYDDPPITELGYSQALRTAQFCDSFLDLKDFVGYTSPIKRCRETADVLSDKTKIEFDNNDFLLDIEHESKAVFHDHLCSLLECLPPKSFLVSHCNTIAKLAQLASGCNVDNCLIPHCSVTFVQNCSLIHIGKLPNHEEDFQN